MIPFIKANIKQENWHQCKAAMMAFGSILIRLDPAILTLLVNQAFADFN